MIGYFLESGMYFLWLIPALIVYLIIYTIIYKRNGVRNYSWHLIGVCVFGLLLTIMLNVTGSATWTDFKIGKSPWIHIQNLNLVPFAGDSVLSFGVIMNIFMFVPFGFLVPMLWKEKESMLQTGLIGMLFSLTIEISQLFNWRACDITDLITNTLGCLLGWMIFRIVSKNNKLRKLFVVNNCSAKKWYLMQEGVLFIVYWFICSFWIKPLAG